MSLLKINPKQGKVLFFSDLHLGVHQNSQTWHNIALDIARWIAREARMLNLDTIFFAGDVFHDRHEIGVNTLHVAKKFFEELEEFNIYILPGNHDAFLSSTVEVNSVEILENKHITVFSKPTTVSVNGKLVTFCPWKTDPTQLECVDMLIGHFELQNFRMNSNKVCEHGDSSTDLLQKARYIVSGHFHFREQRSYKDGYVLYLGSPYEMDFGDREQPKGLTVIDFEDFSTNFIQNQVSPKHFRIKISELLSNKYTNLQRLIAGNIISLYVDDKVDTLTLDMLITKMTQHNPLQFRTDFNVLDTAQIETKDIKKLSIDIETAFQEFVELIDTRSTKKEVLDKCLELYKLSIISHE
jgi:DNA repair exonuclease SbcCD nuclease subunit